MGVEALEEAHVKVSIGKEAIAISGLETGAQVTLCDLSGRVVASAGADDAGSLSINVSDLSKGVFIVAMPGQSFKFIR